MVLQNGVDIVKIARIQKSLESPRFLARVFGVQELEIYKKRGQPLSFLAGNFAAKEAFSKALGTGFRGIQLTDIQVLRDKLGAPYYHLSGTALEQIQSQRLALSLSISHEQEYAVAFVTAWSAL